MGLDRLKRDGSTPYPDGTVFSDDVREYSAVDGVCTCKGATRKVITVMVKDSMLQPSGAAEGAGLHVLEVPRVTELS